MRCREIGGSEIQGDSTTGLDGRVSWGLGRKVRHKKRSRDGFREAG